MRTALVTLLAAAIIAVACGDGSSLNEVGITTNCNPESNAPTRVAGETFATAGGVDVVVVTAAPEANPAQENDQIAAHFTGSLTDGTVFSDSRELLDAPLEFALNTEGVICGWVEGVVGMSPGEVRELTIPPELAYGSGGFGDLIPADATVMFVVEMIEFVETEPAE